MCDKLQTTNRSGRLHYLGYKGPCCNERSKRDGRHECNRGSDEKAEIFYRNFRCQTVDGFILKRQNRFRNDTLSEFVKFAWGVPIQNW